MDDLDKKIHEAYMRVINPLNEMKMTAMDAIAILAKGDENAAWKKAKEDEGLLPNVTKKMWLKWAYASKQYKKLKESTDINEASQIEFQELDDSNKKIITLLVGKGDENNQVYFDGIHGQIATLTGMHGSGSMRFMKNDFSKIKKLLSDKNVRWIEIRSIGF